MNLKLIMTALVLFMTVVNNSAQQKKESLQNLIEEAIKVSPKINMLKSKFKMAASRIEQRTNLPDPVLTVGLANMPVNTFSFTQEPMTGKIIGLSQVIPFPGALHSAAEVKSVDTLIVLQEILDLKNRIKKEVSDYYYGLQLYRKDIRLAKESVELLKQISDVVKRKFEISKASFQNVVKVEVQITRVKDKIEILKGKEKSVLAQLNALLLRNENSPVITEKISGIDTNKYSINSLINLSNLNRPLLKNIRLFIKKSKLMKEKAEYAFYPNFMLGVQYNQRDYIAAKGINLTDFFSVKVGITLPVNYGGKKSEKVNEAEYLQSFYRNRYEATLQILRQSFGKILAKNLELKTREKLIKYKLLPQVQQSYQAALADYQVGKIDFINVINAENNILKIKTELANVRTNYLKNIVQLEFLSGTEFNKNNVNQR